MAVKLLRYLANLGYGSRRDIKTMLARGAVTDHQDCVLSVDSAFQHADVRVDGQALDPRPGMVLMLNKPLGFTCSHADAGRLVYDLLPPRFLRRKPKVSSVGRLDKDTSGLLFLTDDGPLLHRLTSPKSIVDKTYVVALAEDMRGDEAIIFASGSLQLRHDETPLKPARLEVLGDRRARLTIIEGRYHQVRRMFAATGNKVLALHRESFAGLELGGLDQGEWRCLNAREKAQL